MRIQAKKLQRVEERLSKAKGPFEVFALLLREDSPGKWDVLDSAALQAIHQITKVEHGFAEISDRSIFDMPIKQGYVITSRKEAHNGANMAPGNDAIGIRPE